MARLRAKVGDADYDVPKCAHPKIHSVLSEAGKPVAFQCSVCRAPALPPGMEPPKRAKRTIESHVLPGLEKYMTKKAKKKRR